MKKSQTTNKNADNPATTISLPVVLRARGFRLYTGSRRLIDLYLNGGAAVMGHTIPNVLREIKNYASRGLYAPFPHFTQGRLLKALSLLMPEHTFGIYAAPPQELETLYNNGKAELWRPFTGTQPNNKLKILVIPGIQTWRNNLPFGLCVSASPDKAASQSEILSPGETLSPILLAAAARGVYNIIASPERIRPQLPRTYKVLKETSFWQRNGIYLTLKEKPSQEAWAALFEKFLEAGFLLPPVPTQPVILPGELSAGEDTKLAKILSLC